MHTELSCEEHDPCVGLLMVLAVIFLVGIVAWSIRRPKEIVGRNNGKILYGLAIEWPIAFSVGIIAL